MYFYLQLQQVVKVVNISFRYILYIIILITFAKRCTIKGLNAKTQFLLFKMIERLKISVEKKFGKEITSQKDCKMLSNSILEMSGEYLSPATLRRLFGFLLTNSNPSRVTHDILCHYIGVENWDIFIENNRETGSSQNKIIETWSRVLEKSRKISKNTVENIKRKSGISFSKTVDRQFSSERLTSFLESDYNSTALIGPGGYGKTTLLANWYEKNSAKKGFSNDIILFIQAITLTSFASSEAYFEDWLMRQLGLSLDYNFLRSLLSSNSAPPGRFILIIDALDESNLYGSKLEKEFSSIAEFLLKFSAAKWFKLIISTRYYAWSKFKPFIENSEKWYSTEPNDFSPDGANLPLLTTDEIQKIFDNTINTKFSKRTLVNELTLELTETLGYPFFLELFVNVYHPENEYLLNDQIEILREFLKKQVYNSQYSEEKVDILHKLLELSDYGINSLNVKKNTLKDIYPIHLKHAGNYFEAYEDLISFGIIEENDIENRYGGYSKTVRIANRNLFEILLTKSYLEKAEEITLELFKNVARIYAEHELLPQLITRLYQFAYKERMLKPLRSFFDLSDDTLSSVLSNPRIAIALRKDEYMRKNLLPIYASNPAARKYFFEDYPDFNNLTGSFSISLDYYYKHYETAEDENIAFVFSIYSGFLSLDEGKIERFFAQMNEFKPNSDYSPTIVGIWYACKLLYIKFIKNEDVDNALAEAIDFLKKLRSSNTYKFGSFESHFYTALVIANQYGVLAKLTSEDEIIEKKGLGVTKELKLFRYYSWLNSGKQLDLKDIVEIDLILSQLNPMNSYIYQILGQVLKALYYFSNNEMTKAYESFRNSTELSNLAGYRIIEVKLLKNLSNALLKLGEKSKSIECSNFAMHLTQKTGFNYELF